MTNAPIPSPMTEAEAPLPRRSPLIKYGRMLLLIVLWSGVALFGSTSILAIFNAYAVATGFPTNVTPRFLLTIALTNGIAAILCSFLLAKLLTKRKAK